MQCRWAVFIKKTIKSMCKEAEDFKIFSMLSVFEIERAKLSVCLLSPYKHSDIKWQYSLEPTSYRFIKEKLDSFHSQSSFNGRMRITTIWKVLTRIENFSLLVPLFTNFNCIWQLCDCRDVDGAFGGFILLMKNDLISETARN